MILEFDGMRPRIHPTAWIAPTAVVIGNVEIGAEASVWFGAVIRGDERDHVIRIGERTNVQDNCVVHVGSRGPTLVGDDVTLGHCVVIESCEIGNGSLIGMNATVLQQARIGEQVLVAAGSVVASGARIPARHLAAGNPAEVKKEIGRGYLERMTSASQKYVRLSRRYMAGDLGDLQRAEKP